MAIFMLLMVSLRYDHTQRVLAHSCDLQQLLGDGSQWGVNLSSGGDVHPGDREAAGTEGVLSGGDRPRPLLQISIMRRRAESGLSTFKLLTVSQQKAERVTVASSGA
jgi:hypothetical protein